MIFGVRIHFEWQGQLVYEVLGPFDRYLAELVCVDMAGGYLFGMTVVHVQRAMIVPWLAS